MTDITDISSIDLVYTWVDGNDPVWIERHAKFCCIATDNDGSNCKGRYCNNDELKYSLRSIEQYAPWIRKIFIITDNQVPEWLDTSNPKIEIIDHTLIMAKESLPCYNSMTIEHYIKNIPGLSEHFLYANDDTFLNRETKPTDFFGKDGYAIARMNRRPLRKLTLWFKSQVLGKKLSGYNRAIQAASRLVEKRYGKYYGCKTHHNIDAYNLSVFRHTAEIFKEGIGITLTNHIRSDNDVNRNLYTYVALAENKGHLKYVGKKTSYRLHIDKDRYRKMERCNPMFFCLNDSEYATDEDRIRSKEFLDRRFPTKSRFEK